MYFLFLGKCHFQPGVGKTELEWYIGDLVTQDQCIEGCIEKKKEMPHINGVKMYSIDKPGCWCEMGVEIYKLLYHRDIFQTCILETGKL